MSKLQEYEERILTAQLFQSYEDKLYAYQFTKPNSFKGYDGFYQITPRDASVVFETKVREIKIDQYPDYIMEARKLNSLTIRHNKGHQTKYFNFFKHPGGAYDFIGFDITIRIEEWKEIGFKGVVEVRWMNHETFKSRKDKVPKEVIMLTFRPEIDTKIEGGIFKNR